LVFGQCVSTPPAVTQPVVYETIESGLAAPTGRGKGSLSDDMYSVGVTTLALLIGHSPCLGLSDDEIISRKFEMGSYWALLGDERVSLTMMEPLRGLLNDNPQKRWGLEDLVYWINGRRLNPKSQMLPPKAGRAMVVG
jgi:serine/threonine protein kinase